MLVIINPCGMYGKPEGRSSIGLGVGWGVGRSSSRQNSQIFGWLRH